MTAKPPGTSLAIRNERHYLQTVEQIRALCEQIQTVEGAQDLAARAAAAQVWAQRAHLGQTSVNQAAAAKLWAERRAGELLKEMDLQVPGPGRGKKRSQPATALPDDVTKSQSSRWQKMATIPAKAFGDIVEKLVPEGRVTQAEIMRRHGRAEREAKIAADESALVAEVTKAGGPTWSLIESDLRVFDPGTVDAIITDPPYITEDAVELYNELGKFALRVLKPGGALVAMTWQPILLDVWKALDQPGLKYRWTVAWLPGAHETTSDYTRRVFTRWKPVLVFHRGGWAKDAGMVADVVVAGRDAEKGLHEWQQSLGGFRQLVRAVAKPGDLICDPFAGAGTTALAALAEHCSFTGCDIDAAAVRTSHDRLTA